MRRIFCRLPNNNRGAAQSKFIRGIGKIGDSVKLLLDPVKLLSDDALDFLDRQEMMRKNKW